MGLNTRSRPCAVLLVRNHFTHDARVLRAAKVLRDRGFDPLVVAVVSTEVATRADVQEGIPVVRLAPGSPLSVVRRVMGRGGGRGAASGGGAAVSGTAAGPGRRAVRIHRWFRTLDFYRRAVGVLLRARPALVQCNDYNTLWPGVIARLLLPGTAVVYDSHEIWADRNGRPEPRAWLLVCEALLVRLAHAVVAASPGYADVLSRRYRIARPVVVLNVPDRPAARVDPDAEPVAVYVGGLLRHRGIEEAIEALALVPRLRLRVIGGGHEEYVSRLRDRAAALGVADRIEWVGRVPAGTVVDLAAGATMGLALFQPVCLSHVLVAPNKLFEYAAAGVPVLASDLPVMRSFLAEWGFGITAAATDPRAVADAAERLLDPAVNASLREGAARAAERFVWANERRSLETVYERAMAAARG